MRRYRGHADREELEADLTQTENAMLAYFLMMVLLMVVLAITMVARPACSQEIKPLTREEPVVRMVLQEAANEPFAGMVAVAGVALDRAADDRWPASVRDVVYEPYQFSGMDLRMRLYSDAQVTRARLAVAEAEVGTRPCGKVLWYHAAWMMPKWDFNKIVAECQIGLHVFYGDR